MILTSPQKVIAADPHRFRVVDCGRRFGKTILAAEEILGAAIKQDDMVVPYIAPTFQQARDIAWRHFVRRFKPITLSVNESRLEITVKTLTGGQSLIPLRSWEAIESLRGQKFPFIVFDEVAMYRQFWEGWQEVVRPALSDYRGGALFASTPHGFNHFYDLFNLQEDGKVNANDEWKSFHYTTYDNPFIPVEEIDAARLSMTEDRFGQEYLAEFRKLEGLVYKEFSRDTHLFDDFTKRPPVAEVIAGVDFGFTNPSVIVRIEHDVDNHYWLTDEWYRTGKTTLELIEQAKTMGINTFYPDPAEPDRIEDMKRAGLNCREVSKDIEKGVESVRELFKQGRLHIHKDCLNTIAELESYHYPDKRPTRMDGNEPEVPVKEKDHAMDALRYALFMNAPAYQDDEYQDFGLYSTNYG